MMKNTDLDYMKR